MRLCGQRAPSRAFFALALVSSAAQGCFEPGKIPDAEEFYAAVAERIDAGDLGGGGAGDAAMPPVDDGTPDSGPPPSTGCGDVPQTIFAEKCANPVCHGQGNALDLESSGLDARLLSITPMGICEDERYVDPTTPASSLIYAKLTADPPCGSRMPLGGDPLTDAELACVLEYLTEVGSNPAPMTDGGTDASTQQDASDPLVDASDPGEGEPGLLAGTLAGAFNTGEDNPGDLGVDALGLSRTETSGWPADTTYVMTGEIHFGASGVLSFYENIDDSVLLVIDGQTVLDNEVWDEPTSGTIMRAEGWYDFELRLGNGTGDAGPTVAGEIGFGMAESDTMGNTDSGMYSHPENSSATSADRFRYVE